ncbi:MAG TPA: hypothetical protein EYP98_05150, partial [Planctomycetes bacterium]|nr:hypothetical protein [Planctomycetota bacterium]
MLNGLRGLWLVVCLLLSTQSAFAVTVGSYPSQPSKTYRVHGRTVVLGNTLMDSTTDTRFNSKLLPSSASSIGLLNKLPDDSSIKAAYVFWTGTAKNFANPIADDTVSFKLADGQTVAIKVLLAGSSSRQRKRFAREAQLLAKLQTPGIVRIFESGNDEQLSWMAMEFVEGETL